MKKIYILIIAIFTINIASAQSPTITSFFPLTGAVGTITKIIGTNLTNSISLKIGGVNAIVISNTDTNLVGMIMPGSTSGNISITTTNGIATSSNNFIVTPTSYPSIQQGNKLRGTGFVRVPFGSVGQGYSVAISADGNTAIFGAPYDSNYTGAAWVYIRSNGNWIQQGNKLVAIGAYSQGYSVAISADGNTVVLGGRDNITQFGAGWIFRRNNSVWTQYGNPLIGIDAVGQCGNGPSVAMSADGNTVILGSEYDNNYAGAAWIFKYNGNTWTQQGNKLVGTGVTTKYYQGYSVAISGDGKTALVGGYGGSANHSGATWVFTYNGVIWTQQGSKLVGSGLSLGSDSQGFSVALSADGNNAIIGGPTDNDKGAVWIFTRIGGVWTQQGNKLVGTGCSLFTQQGHSVSISADGNTVLVGGWADDTVGAVWVYKRIGGQWIQKGNKLIGTGAIGESRQGWSVSLSADGNTAIVGAIEDSLIGASWIYISDPNTSIKSYINDQDIIIYPNPAKNQITIECNSIKNQNLAIYNLLGQIVYTTTIKDKADIDISTFQKGVFFIKINTDKQAIVKKFVKE